MSTPSYQVATSEIGNAVRHRRISQKMSRDAVARLVGISGQHLKNFEAGDALIKFEYLVKIARALNCTVADLLRSTCLRTDAENANRELAMAMGAGDVLLECFLSSNSSAARGRMIHAIAELEAIPREAGSIVGRVVAFDRSVRGA